MSEVSVYVPAPGKLAWILPGSGIVGNLDRRGMVGIYYEGNRYGAESLNTYLERVRCAADRMRLKYPTIARALVLPDDVVEIGRYDHDHGRVVHVSDRKALTVWIGEPVEAVLA